jgi:hypothetical protein
MIATRSILIRRPAELTASWAQRVVDHLVPGATVSALDVLSMEVGTTTRVRVAVGHDGPGSLPQRWFVKLPSGSWKARGITLVPRLLQAEVRFYHELSRRVPVPQPSLLAAESALGRGITIVLADVTERGALAGAPADALSLAQATAVVDRLAGLHACFWGDPRLGGACRWLAGAARRWEVRLGTALAVPLMRRGLCQAGGSVPRALHGPAMRYARQRRRVMGVLAEGPQALVHHDCHAGNLFWEDAGPGLLDWQLVRIGEGIGDVAYCLATALEPATRRTHEAYLVERYREGLLERGVRAPDFAHLWHRYRAHLTYPFEAMVVTLAVGGMMRRASNLELIRRAAAAVEDLDAFAVVLG